MRFRVRKFAHVLERSGLALAGAACGVFVGAHVGSTVPWLTTQGFLLLMMLSGAFGFYLGIDTPPLPFHPHEEGTLAENRIDAAEFLSAFGTLLATFTAFVSVVVIIMREQPRIFWTWAIMAGWFAGVVMQIVAGAIARARK
jgi:Trk-type K+ transport system membrane component